MHMCESRSLRACGRAHVCALDGVRDTGQRSDMSGWHPVKASWQRVVMLPSGSRTPLLSQFFKIHIVLAHM